MVTKALAYVSASVYVVLEDEDLYQVASVSLSPSLFSPSRALLSLPGLTGVALKVTKHVECSKLTGLLKSFI